MIDSDRLRQALASALESNEGIPAARNGRATIDGVEYTAVPAAELEELRAMKQRAQRLITTSADLTERYTALHILGEA